MKNLCQWIITFFAGGLALSGHPAQFHEKVQGKLISGRVIKVSENRIHLDKGDYTFLEGMKITKIETLQKPTDLKEFAFVGYSGGELTSLPDWYPLAFRVGETTAAGVLRRSRQNPDKHFILANRRIFRLPEEGVRRIKKHVELKEIPKLHKNQQIYLIAEHVDGNNIANAICIVPFSND